MIADPISLKRVHIACAVMLSFAACGIAPSRKIGLEPSDVADSFTAKDSVQSTHVKGVKNADTFVRAGGRPA